MRGRSDRHRCGFGQLADKVGKDGETAGVSAVAGARAVDAPLDQTGVFQDPEVLRDSGLGERQFCYHFAATAARASEQ